MKEELDAFTKESSNQAWYKKIWSRVQNKRRGHLCDVIYEWPIGTSPRDPCWYSIESSLSSLPRSWVPEAGLGRSWAPDAGLATWCLLDASCLASSAFFCSLPSATAVLSRTRSWFNTSSLWALASVSSLAIYKIWIMDGVVGKQTFILAYLNIVKARRSRMLIRNLCINNWK